MIALALLRHEIYLLRTYPSSPVSHLPDHNVDNIDQYADVRRDESGKIERWHECGVA